MNHDIASRLRAAVQAHQAGRLDIATAGYRKILKGDPQHFDARHLLGVAILQSGAPEAALGHLGQAVRLRPDNPEALVNLGNALRESGRPEHAVTAIDRALRVRPTLPQAHYNRALALYQQGDLAGALAAYDQAISLQPGYVEAVFNRGVALQEIKRLDEAQEAFAHVLRLNPDCPYAAGKHCYTRLLCCDWSHFDADRDAVIAGVRAGRRVCDPFSFAGIDDNPETQLCCAKTYATHRFPPAPQPLWRGERYRHDRIRVAYVSADFHDHPAAHLAAGLFERHDRSIFEVTAIALGPNRTGALRQRLVSAFDHFLEVGSKSPRAIAETIRAREIDIAVDLMGYTQGSQPEIFALRPAPVQIAFLGQPATTGAPYIDYLIADPFVIPEHHAAYFSEQLVYLPDCYLVCDDLRARPAPDQSRIAAGLPATGFVFCCFNNPYKITPKVFAIWMQLLREVPGSVLWLLADQPRVLANLRAAAQAAGVSPDRLIFAPRIADNERHLARQALADLFLDTLPFNAHTTANEALWMGLPLLTCPGASFASRVAASQLRAIGLPELIATDLKDYKNRALTLARDPHQLGALRARLIALRESQPLFATDRYRRHIEHAFQTLWEIRERGDPPRSFSVRPS